MTVDFNFNFWTMMIFGLNLWLAIYGIISARGRASAEALEKIKTDSAGSLALHKEKCGQLFTAMSERLKAVETNQTNSITHDDLSAVHKRVDDVHKMLSEIGRSVSRVEGLLEGRTTKA